MVEFRFDANQHEPDQPFEVLPEGWYPVFIENSEIKTTKANDGHYLSVRFRVLYGPAKNRVVFTNFNIDNKNQQAVEIAQRQLSAMCRACGVMVVQDTQQLHGKNLEIKLGIAPAQGQYEARNNVKGYRALEQAPEVANQAQQQPPQQAQQQPPQAYNQPMTAAPAVAPAPTQQAPATAPPAAQQQQETLPPWMRD